MTANVIAFASRTANRAVRAQPAAGATERHDNIVSINAWLDRARPRRTPTGVYFTTGVLATQGFSA